MGLGQPLRQRSFALLDKYGLDATSTHTGANNLRNSMQATIQFHKDAGVNRLIIPSFNANSAEGWAKLRQGTQRLGC